MCVKNSGAVDSGIVDFRCASGHQRVLRSEGHHADVGAVASGVCCGRVVVEFRFILLCFCLFDADSTVALCGSDADGDIGKRTGNANSTLRFT